MGPKVLASVNRLTALELDVSVPEVNFCRDSIESSGDASSAQPHKGSKPLMSLTVQELSKVNMMSKRYVPLSLYMCYLFIFLCV